MDVRTDTHGARPRDASIWQRIARFCFRRRWVVLGSWLAAVLVVIGAVGTIGSSSDGSFSIPDSESKRGFDTLGRSFEGFGAGLTGSVVFRADQGVDDPLVAATMQALLDDVADIDGVRLTSPYTEEGRQRGLVAFEGDAAGRIASASISLAPDVGERESSAIGRSIEDLTETAYTVEVDGRATEVVPAEVDGLQIEVGGAALGEFEPPESELIGLSFAIVILIVSFGSVLAMGLPIGVALFGVGIGAGIISLLSNVMSVPDFAITLGAMIGLGVGIDYALFIVTRYREGLRAGQEPEEAAVVALDTAGRAVVFAGFTVVISLLGMFIMGLAFINGLATGAAVTVLVTMVASVTLLPAFLGFAGERIEVTRRRGLIAAALVAIALLGVGLGIQPLLVGAPLALVVRVEIPRRREKPVRETWSYRWSRLVQRNSWLIALGVTGLLVVMTLPVLGLRLGFSDESNFPTDTTTFRAYELTTEGFGAGANGPLILTAELSGPEDLGRLAGLVDVLSATEGIARASGPLPSDPVDPAASAAAIVQVVPTTGPQDSETADLVDRLRTSVIPDALVGSDLTVNVSGSVAANIDFSSYLARRIPLFFAAVLTLSFLLLMMVFRSLLVPLKAVVMNMLSIGAAYGVVVAVFQWGWASSLFDTAGGPIEPFVPMMLFAIVFGLSMDYEVFLLSRVKEEFDRTGDPVNSVADGLAMTARVITAAAAIMVVVFASFVFEDNRIIKLFGLGLSSAVFLDATLVRMLLVPATMELLGAKNWWLPAWLDRLLPTLDVEGPSHRHESTADDDAPDAEPAHGDTAEGDAVRGDAVEGDETRLEGVGARDGRPAATTPANVSSRPPTGTPGP